MGRHHPAAACVAAASAPVPAARVVRGATLRAAPWKNAGGVTREIAAYPVGASLETFVWRASVADIERAGPFSRFPGIDRTLVLLAGAGMHLTQARGRTHALLQPLAIARFDGDSALDAQLVDGATRDFNLMFRRDRAKATLEIWEGADARTRNLDGDAALVFCARGALDVRLSAMPASDPTHAMQATQVTQVTQVTLAWMDTLVLDAPRDLACEMTGEGAAIAVLIRYT